MPGIETLSLEQVRALYRQRMVEDFPPDELRPLQNIENLLNRNQYAGYGYMDGGEALAYAFFVKQDRRALVDDYPVRRDLRDRGHGGRFLRALIKGPARDLECALLEVEDPAEADAPDEAALRDRRLAFYLRNGLQLTQVRARIYGVKYRLLTLPVGVPHDDHAVAHIYAELYRTVLPKPLYDQWVEIDPLT